MADLATQDCVARIEALLNSGVARGVPGASAAIHGASGRQFHLHAGYSNIESKELLTAATVFGIGSITKVFVAVVVLQLVEERRLRLEDTVGGIVSGLSRRVNAVPHADSATISELLSHTSAIASWEFDADWIRAGRGKHIQVDKIWAKDETLTYVKRSVSENLRKGKFNYANTNYTILGLIVEHVTDNTLESEVRRRILEPLNLEHTYFDSFERPPLTVSLPHRYHWATDTFRDTAGVPPCFRSVSGRGDLHDVTVTNLSVSWAAGGMFSTPSDLLNFAAALRKPREADGLLSATSLKVLMSWHRINDQQDIGCGIFRLRDGEGRLWAGHSGGVLGSSATWWYALEGEQRGCAVAILSNVGTMHTDTFPASVVHDPTRLEILEIAAKL